jgi:hypothetical protein
MTSIFEWLNDQIVQDAALEEHQTEVKQLEEAKAQVPLEESCHFSAGWPFLGVETAI